MVPRILTSLCALALVAGAVSCRRKEAGGSQPSAAVSAAPDKAFGRACTILMEALTDPKAPLHFSYHAQAQINPAFPREAGSRPEIAPVIIEADVSPAEISLESVRGTKKNSAKVKKEDDLAWGMAKLGFLGPMGDMGINLAFAAPLARVSGSETLAGAPADVYAFDSTTATPEQKAGIRMAQAMLPGLIKQESIRGSIAVDKATGRMVKFNFDVEFSEKSGQTWKEHHEGFATSK